MDLHGPVPQRPQASTETERTIASNAPQTTELDNHVFEGQPPQYGDPPASDEKSRKKERRTTCIKMSTSIFIAVIVCLVAAAVIGKIHENQARKYAAAASASHTK
jgi:hypothetical protein